MEQLKIELHKILDFKYDCISHEAVDNIKDETIFKLIYDLFVNNKIYMVDENSDGLLCYFLGKYVDEFSEGLSYYEMSAKKNNKYGINEAAFCYFCKKDYKHAIEYYSMTEKKDIWIFYDIGRCYKKLGDYENTIKYWRLCDECVEKKDFDIDIMCKIDKLIKNQSGWFFDYLVNLLKKQKELENEILELKLSPNQGELFVEAQNNFNKIIGNITTII